MANDTPEALDLPRWRVTIVPAANGEALLEAEVYADGVTWGELTHIISKVLPHTSKNPTGRLPTKTELEAQRSAELETQRETEWAKEHPATRLLVKDGEELWLGADSPADTLIALGWTGIAAPKGVARGCEYARDPEAFRTKYLVLRWLS